METETLKECPLCNSTSWRTLPIPGRWIGLEVFNDLADKIGLVKCRSCELIFINPRPSVERLTAFYSGSTYTCHEADGSASAGSKADFILGRIEKHMSSRDGGTHSVLDYGAGGGGFLAHMRDHGWDAEGFEPGQRGLESCKKQELKATDKLDEVPAGKFSLVTLHHVFEHLPNPIEVLDGIRKFLASEGMVYIEVPNARSLRADLAAPIMARNFRVDERFRAFPIHLMYYSDKTLRRMMEKAGWRVLETLTLGMGLDEYFIRNDQQDGGIARLQNPDSVRVSKRSAVRSPRKRVLRHLIRDAFLSFGWGENLGVIAVPSKDAG
jgi:2-polyprenyl-3-methyl-5-hydroxy-6-metoxy-1,4-benzoquinol methylase